MLSCSLSLSFRIVGWSFKCVQFTACAPVAHCPSVCGVALLSHSWQRSACLRVTGPQLTGVTAVLLRPRSGLSFIPVRSNWLQATRRSCYVGGMSRAADSIAALELDLTLVNTSASIALSTESRQTHDAALHSGGDTSKMFLT